MTLPKTAINWRPPPLTKKKDAHYHTIKATEEWANFVAALEAAVTRSAAERAAEDAQHKRETTYARGTLGGS